MSKLLALALGAVLGGCVIDDPDVGETVDPIASENKLAANKLAANKLAANKLAANKLAASALTSGTLISTADGREVLTYVVKCALPAGRSLSVLYAGTTYTFAGEIGLAAGWETRAPTTPEKHWVSACVLARTNFYGQSVAISLRGSSPALATTAAEVSAYKMDEAGFYGDLFAATPVMYACQSRKNYNPTAAAAGLRKCAETTDQLTTYCGFTFTGFCHSGNECGQTAPPYTNCHSGKNGAGTMFPEVITVFLQP